MKIPVPENLRWLAQSISFPLYLVGGSVRDALAGFPPREISDFDVAFPVPEEALLGALEKAGFAVKNVYRNTGTVKAQDRDGVGYEFARFRSDKYVRGMHTPVETEFTGDISLDARRRDFCVNALYYDVKTDELIDPLGGALDVENKILRTVADPNKVFGEDGLRLMRLARIAAETGFSPDMECLAGARAHAALIRDIAPERIYTELNLLLHADLKHGDKTAHYRGLKILQATRVLHEILPELALGEGMEQRLDFHKYDVLEHSFRCVLYAPPEIRFAALLHDVGKPFCFERDGNFHEHADEGARITLEILTRLKVPKKMTEETAELVRLHMRDFNLAMRECKVRRELVQDYPLLPKLFALKQADFSACKDDLSPAPSVQKWEEILNKMKKEGAPLTLKELAVDGKELIALGAPPQTVSTLLKELLNYCAEDGTRNKKEYLVRLIKKRLREDI